MTDWDERFRTGDYPSDPAPSPLLRHYAPSFPDGLALDVATGTGRNAVFLAEAGFEVDAIDSSREGLQIARRRAREWDVDDRVRWIQADAGTLAYPPGRYAAITVSYYRALDLFPDLQEALVPGGYLFVEHHLRSPRGELVGPKSDRYRFASNELLRAGLGMTVLHYDETVEERPDGERSANARLLARKTWGPRQRYPPRPRLAERS